ncbi:hypothetical protein [Pseudorhodobacter sp.]|uniref:hypothetical protein n=1 Tax=Pseudorhodobacter sp. TaxID=1934400 RepID=UPI002648AA0B|nr:hypothetical protein [Pseudorhodobacter sp.]MDN5786391.1 hypothetical protein [Pseudorhodobacter sp.]
MTTKVTVSANHGWPVDVTFFNPDVEDEGTTFRVARGETRDFHVYDTRDLMIHEVQPRELAKEVA